MPAGTWRGGEVGTPRQASENKEATSEFWGKRVGKRNLWQVSGRSTGKDGVVSGGW